MRTRLGPPAVGFALIGLSVLLAAPCMAQSPDPFRSAPPPASDSLRSRPIAIPAKPASRPPVPRPSREAEPPPADPESVLWQTIAASNNPADLEGYLERFPQGRFVNLARSRLAVLRPPSPAAAIVPSAPAPSPAAPPSAQPVRLDRTVPHDIESRLANYSSFLPPTTPYCRAYLLPALTIMAPPTNGTVRFDTVQVKPPECANSIEATAVFYKPRPGFLGNDQFSFVRKGDGLTLGFDRRISVVVTVY